MANSTAPYFSRVNERNSVNLADSEFGVNSLSYRIFYN